jgi:hypothetical protein
MFEDMVDPLHLSNDKPYVVIRLKKQSNEEFGQPANPPGHGGLRASRRDKGRASGRG